MTDLVAAGPPDAPRRRVPALALVGSGLVAGIVLAGVVLAGLTTAAAQTDPTPSPSAAAPAQEDRRDRRDKPDGHRKHRGGPLGGGRGLLKDVVHGEFTVRTPDGFQDMAGQRGEATAVSATSVTVRSADGFSRTYAVTGDTLVNAGDEGIADVSAGDQVYVLARVDGDRATAVRVVDVTEVRRLRDRWRR